MRCVMAAVSVDPEYVVDACVWVSAFVPQDVLHAPSRSWLGSEDTDLIDVACPALVLPEVAGSVSRAIGTNASGIAAVDAMVRLSTLHLVDLDASLAREAAHLAATLRLRGADAVYVALAAQMNVPFVTWDKELLKRAAIVIDVRSPPAI